MNKRVRILMVMAVLSCATTAQADITVQMNMVDDQGIGKSIGHVLISETPYGAVFTPSLAGLPPGLHGFHLHENSSCDPKEKDGKMEPAAAAGGHYDPKGSKQHGLPWGEGHLGDLPALVVDTEGKATNPVLAPRLKLSDVKGRALMIHAGGDNYGDRPKPLGGGGDRIACGVIQ